MNKEFANEYATALFDVLLEEQKLEQNYEDLKTITFTISSSFELIQFLTHPKVTKDEKKAFIKTVFTNIDDVLLKFMFVLIDNNRLHDIQHIFERYTKLFNEYNKLIEVKAITTSDMTHEQEQKLVEKLTLKYRKKIQINHIIDKTIIGGMRLVINDEIIDNTVINQLRNLKSYVLKQN